MDSLHFFLTPIKPHNSIFSPKMVVLDSTFDQKCLFWIPILAILALLDTFLRTSSHGLRNLFASLRTVFATCSHFFAPSFALSLPLLRPLFGTRSQFSTCATQPLHNFIALRVRRACIKRAMKW